MAAQIPAPVKAFLEKPNFAVLATQSVSGKLQATPIWFLHIDGHILINTSAGRAKLRNMQAHPGVALAIVDRKNPYRCVQVRGSVVRFDKENGAKDIDRLSQRYHGRPYQYSPGEDPQNRISIYIEVERVTAMGL